MTFFSSIALGLPVPFLFALYSVYFDLVITPNDRNHLAAIQVSCLALAATALIGFISLVRSWGAVKLLHNRDSIANIILLNFFSMLGPPLWFVTIVKLGASRAN